MLEPKELWEYLKEFYKEKFGIEPNLVDVMSNIDILKLCATGASNGSISKTLDIDVEDIADVLDKYFAFRGWLSDLESNPLLVYKSKDFETLEEYKNFLFSTYGTFDGIEEMYNSVVVTTMLERLLDENWI